MPRADRVHSTQRILASSQHPTLLLATVKRLRKEAADEIERLIAFLDEIGPDADLELAGDEFEPTLAAPENHPTPPIPSTYSRRLLRHCDRSGDQTRWGDQGNSDDREGDAGHDDREGDELQHGGCERDDYELSGDEDEPSDTGIGDADGLLEQLGYHNGNFAFAAI